MRHTQKVDSANSLSAYYLRSMIEIKYISYGTPSSIFTRSVQTFFHQEPNSEKDGMWDRGSLTGHILYSISAHCHSEKVKFGSLCGSVDHLCGEYLNL